jgi:hypothetical protein
MIQADSVHSTPPLSSSSTQEGGGTTEASLSKQPLADAAGSIEQIDLALLRFVSALLRWGLSLEEAGAVVASELERFRIATNKTRRRKFDLVGPVLASWIAE